MSDADRDDLEAAQTRASELEREVEELRKRNAELEGAGETDEARENARRLAAAIEREREEAQIRDDRKLDDAMFTQAAQEAAIARAKKKLPSAAAVMASLAPGCFVLALVAMGTRKTPHQGEPHPVAAAILAGLGLVLLCCSGLYLWVEPRRRRLGRPSHANMTNAMPAAAAPPPRA